ncbi:hypothetical protein ACLECU_16795, partial [Lonsdalea quercina]|uniref:hypothetical protein n=1 Tax=Lonsdalea quercina TaxID=71657 RepID=UPI0039757CFC
ASVPSVNVTCPQTCVIVVTAARVATVFPADIVATGTAAATGSMADLANGVGVTAISFEDIR